MKTKAIIILAVLFTGSVFAATNDITVLLQKGLFEEEANHNLDAALRQYQAAVDGYDQDRQLAATAVFRLGECYRKLGKTNEAEVQYQRVLRDFPDQTPLADLSRQYLGNKTPVAGTIEPLAGPATSAEDEEVQKIREMIHNSPDLINATISGSSVNPLQNAVVNGNVAAAELLLANGADVNTRGGNGRTPLGLASENGNKVMIELLLARGADVNELDNSPDGQTPLHRAVSKGFKSVVEVLLAHKADVNARRTDGFTPLYNACSQGFTAVAELLIQSGAEVDARAKDGSTPLFGAVAGNHPSLVQLLLDHKAEVNATNFIGQTALFRASDNRHAETARVLLEAGADVNHRDQSSTALFNPAKENQGELVHVLLTHKADANATNSAGFTPLLYAAGRSVDIALIKDLLAHGADPQACGKSGSVVLEPLGPPPGVVERQGQPWGINHQTVLDPGMFALNLAMTVGRTDVMEALLAAHADPNARFSRSTQSGNDLDGTPLLWVFECNFLHAEEMKILLEHGANPDLADAQGRTPLIRAASIGQLDLVQLLLDHHADPNKMDANGVPPLGYAGADEIRTALLKAGANEDYQRMARIFVAQAGTGSLGQEVFYRGTNTANHYSLLETLAMTSQNGYFSPVNFPDLAHVIINRLKAGGGKQELPINLEEILASGDCSKDVPLEWGDVVQVPQKDHLLNEGNSPLPDAYKDALRKCLERHVKVIVKGQPTDLTLLANIADVNQMAPAAHGTTLYTFWLSEVIRQANILLLSSDLSRVKVTRNGVEMLYDLEQRPERGGRGRGGRVLAAPGLGGGGGRGGGGGGFGGAYAFGNPGPASPDLWLRDGDVIEIPERDPNAAGVK